MTTDRRRSPSVATPSAAQVAAAIEARNSGGWYRTAGFCHGKTGRANTTLAFRDADSGHIQVKCFAGCTEGEGWKAVRDELLRRAGFEPSLYSARPGDSALPKPAPRAATKTQEEDPVEAILDALVSIPRDHDHPARRWAATKERDKDLVSADSPFPASVGWIDRAALLRVARSGDSPAHRMYRYFRGAGALVIPLAPPPAWNARLRPSREDIRGAQLIHLDADGGKRFLFEGDASSDKRSVRRADAGESGLRGCVGLLHMPEIAVVVEVNLAEGLADALAVLRYGRGVSGHVVGMAAGASGFSGLGAEGLGFASRVRLWTDSDDGGDGQRAALGLAKRLANAGLVVSLAKPPAGSDPASAPLRRECPDCGRRVSPSYMTESGRCRGCVAFSGG